METIIFVSKSPRETQKIGRQFAAAGFTKNKRSPNSLVIGLEGDLGAGKTNFAKGLAKGLGVKEGIASPTFVILKKYAIREKAIMQAGFKHFYHIDAYRISSAKEMEVMDFRRIIGDPSNIVAIEWAEHIVDAIPQNALTAKFEYTGKSSRKIVIFAPRRFWPPDHRGTIKAKTGTNK